MKEFFEVLEEHADAAIFIAFFVYMLADCITSNLRKKEINMNQMDIKLSKMQLIHLRNICKKGWGGYSKPSDDLEEMVKNGLLTKSAGPFGDVVYRPTGAGHSYINVFQ